jgi:photosystem II stability/assembly factor-like uncharacterized protein
MKISVEPIILLTDMLKNEKLLYTPILLLLSIFAHAQLPRVEILTSDTKTSLRGLSVVNDNVIWVSGSNGMVGKSTNAGKNWKWMVVKGFEKKDFRDIEAFDASTAIIMASGDEAYILKTIDGGDSWKVVYENKSKGMFLDAMDFASNQLGIVIGDPINGKAFIARTQDNGNSWQEMAADHNRAATDSGEAFFAASGSNVRYFASNDYFIVSGGTKSRLISNSNTTSLPIAQGKESTGANSLDIYDNGFPDKPGSRMVITGGDFNEPASTEKNCYYTTNGGKTWKAPKIPPHGYRSSVEFLSKNDILACGLNGVDYSADAGKTWKWISKEGFHVCRIARIGTAIFLAGGNGKVGKLVFPE